MEQNLQLSQPSNKPTSTLKHDDEFWNAFLLRRFAIARHLGFSGAMHTLACKGRLLPPVSTRAHATFQKELMGIVEKKLASSPLPQFVFGDSDYIQMIINCMVQAKDRLPPRIVFFNNIFVRFSYLLLGYYSCPTFVRCLFDWNTSIYAFMLGSRVYTATVIHDNICRILATALYCCGMVVPQISKLLQVNENIIDNAVDKFNPIEALPTVPIWDIEIARNVISSGAELNNLAFQIYESMTRLWKSRVMADTQETELYWLRMVGAHELEIPTFLVPPNDAKSALSLAPVAHTVSTPILPSISTASTVVPFAKSGASVAGTTTFPATPTFLLSKKGPTLPYPTIKVIKPTPIYKTDTSNSRISNSQSAISLSTAAKNITRIIASSEIPVPNSSATSTTSTSSNLSIVTLDSTVLPTSDIHTTDSLQTVKVSCPVLQVPSYPLVKTNTEAPPTTFAPNVALSTTSKSRTVMPQNITPAPSGLAPPTSHHNAVVPYYLAAPSATRIRLSLKEWTYFCGAKTLGFFGMDHVYFASRNIDRLCEVQLSLSVSMMDEITVAFRPIQHMNLAERLHHHPDLFLDSLLPILEKADTRNHPAHLFFVDAFVHYTRLLAGYCSCATFVQAVFCTDATIRNDISYSLGDQNYTPSVIYRAIASVLTCCIKSLGFRDVGATPFGLTTILNSCEKFRCVSWKDPIPAHPSFVVHQVPFVPLPDDVDACAKIDNDSYSNAAYYAAKLLSSRWDTASKSFTYTKYLALAVPREFEPDLVLQISAEAVKKYFKNKAASRKRRSFEMQFSEIQSPTPAKRLFSEKKRQSPRGKHITSSEPTESKIAEATFAKVKREKDVDEAVDKAPQNTSSFNLNVYLDSLTSSVNNILPPHDNTGEYVFHPASLYMDVDGEETSTSLEWETQFTMDSIESSFSPASTTLDDESEWCKNPTNHVIAETNVRQLLYE